MNKEIKTILNSTNTALRKEDLSLADLYALTFCAPERIMAECTEGFRIRTYTYGQVKDLCERTAKGIYDAVGEGHRYIGLEMENSVEWIAAFWGILKSGNKPYLINTRHPKALSDRILKALGVEHIIAKEPGSLDGKYLLMADLQGEGECPAAFENELALATSGTSLKETICIYTGKNIAAQIANAEGIIRANPRMAATYKGRIKNLAFLPFYHVFGLVAVYFWFTCYRMTLVFLPDLSPDTILKTCRRHEVTHIFAVPLLWHTVEKQVLKQAEEEGQLQKLQKGLTLCTKLQDLFPIRGADLSQKIMHSVTDRLFGQSVKFCISGGSALRSDALKLTNGLGYPLHNGYGMSEIGIASVELGLRPKDRNLNSVGKPFGSVEYRINAEGVLEVKGASLCDRRRIDGQDLPMEGWFETGDLAELSADRRCFVKGRKGDTVIGESGENINPDSIEALLTLRDAMAFSVLGLPGKTGEVPAVVVQISPYITKEKLLALKAELEQLNKELPMPAQLRAFYATTDPIMAQTAIKVSRAWLKREIAEGSVTLQDLSSVKAAAAGEFDRQSPLAQKVLEIVGEVLGIPAEQIDPDAHLMLELDATSLQYFSILSALAEEFKVSASSGEEYRYTVRAFCEYLERQL